MTLRFGRLLLATLAALTLASVLPAQSRKPHAPTRSRTAATPAPKGPVTLAPALVEAGSPELIRVEAAGAEKVNGEWLGLKLEFFRASGNKSVWYALAGADVETPTGPSKLTLTAHLHDAQGAPLTRDLSRDIAIRPAHYATGSLTVAPKFVEPGPEDKAEIDASVKAKQKAFAHTEDKPLWSGSFLPPVKAASTASFGTRRMFNGKLASIHKGTDFRAASGTPVLAGNSGTVILAQPLYYEGGCVMIDHGLGLVSISMHLSRIDVKPGQKVGKRDPIGLSGATGRVTGPHLHWAIRWQGAMLDPVKLLHLNLNDLR